MKMTDEQIADAREVESEARLRELIRLQGKLDDAKALIREMAALVYGMANYSTDCTCSMCEEKRQRRDEIITKMEEYL